jgi:uncharacterized protein DUF3313
MARLRSGVFAIVLLLGCAGRAPGPSGFLGDYSQLEHRGGSPARLVYLDPAVDFSRYERVIVDPVVVWKSDEARFAGISPAQREVLARELQAELERACAQEFGISRTSGPGSLRVRTALTAATAAPRSSDPERLESVAVELEIVDAVTHQRLAAAVDSKAQVDAKAAFEEWGDRVAARLSALRDVDRQQRSPETP